MEYFAGVERDILREGIINAEGRGFLMEHFYWGWNGGFKNCLLAGEDVTIQA